MLQYWRAVAGDRRELRLKGHILLELLGRGEPKCKQPPPSLSSSAAILEFSC